MESFSLSFCPSSWGALGLSAPNSGCTVDELFTAWCFSSTRGFSRCETSTNPSASSNEASPESVKSSSETSQGYAVMRVSWHEGLHLTSAFVPARMEVALKSQIHSKKIAKSQRPGRVSILGDVSHFRCVKNVPLSLLSVRPSSPGKVEFANVLRGGAAVRAQVFQVLMQTMHQRRSWRLIPGRQERGAPHTHPRLNLTGKKERKKAALLIKFYRLICVLVGLFCAMFDSLSTIWRILIYLFLVGYLRLREGNINGSAWGCHCLEMFLTAALEELQWGFTFSISTGWGNQLTGLPVFTDNYAKPDMSLCCTTAHKGIISRTPPMVTGTGPQNSTLFFFYFMTEKHNGD